MNAEPLFDNNVLQLSYEHGQACHDSTVFRRTVILFVCDLDEEVGQPEFLHEDNNCMYIFQWRTQLACKPQISHCGAVDPETGAEYHLDALMRQDYDISVYDRGTAWSSNWLALDDADHPDKAKYAFRINVCRPLVPDSMVGCGPFAAACQSELDKRTHHTIGYPLQAPVVEDGRLRLTYTLGDASGCSVPRTAHIEFSCNPEVGALGTPVFEFEGRDCDYHFSWSTSAACPQGGTGAETTSTTTAGPNTGQHACHIVDHVTGEEIDLSGLGTDGLLHTTGVGPSGTEYDFFVGVCQESEKADLPECKGMGACQMRDGLTVGLGKANHHLFFENDQLMLEYTGGKRCHDDKFERKTTLFFRCDHSETGTPRLKYLQETDDCNYRFEVYTARVCSRVRYVPCSALDLDQPVQPVAYDLTPLMLDDEDYLVEIPDPGSMGGSLATLTINVCRSLVKPPAGCENFYSACMSTHHSHNDPLGLPASPYVSSDHQLRMDYVSPGCEHGAAPTTNTTIIFQCSPDGEEHLPVLASPPDLAACAYVVLWETPLACAPGERPGGEEPTTPAATPDPSALSRDDCVVSNEYDRFDLSGLGSVPAKHLREDDAGEFDFVVSACGSVECRNKDGLPAAVCQSNGEGAWSLGQFTQVPQLEEANDGQVKVVYTGGSPCDQKARTSRVTFKCEHDAARHGAVFEGETATCEYEFTWYTDVVCPQAQVPHHPLGCSVEDPDTGRVYHLDDLMRSNAVDENWLARNAADDEDGAGGAFNFYINVCRPLVPAPIDSGELSEVCRGSGVCQVNQDGRAYSGGFAMHEPVFDSSGDVVLRYSLPHNYETRCHKDFVRSASIRFTCLEGTLGHPVFVGETDECEYMFEWATSAVCEYQHLQGDHCRVTDPETGSVFDFSPMAGLLVETTGDGYTYELAVCSSPDRGGFSGCRGDGDDVGACQTDPSSRTSFNMGTINARPFVTDAGVALEYKGGEDCHNHKFKRSTYIEFVCAVGVGAGSPEFVEELDDCSYVFRWATEYACERQTDFECVLTDSKGQEYDLSPLKLLHDNWLVDNTAQADEYEYILNVCHNVNPVGVAANCTGNAGACQWSELTHNTFNLGHPAEPEMVNGRLQMALEGGTPCGGVPRRTVVTFECKQPTGDGHPLGTPRFDLEDSCEYHVVWETSVACAVDDGPEEPTTECVFEDPVSGTVFDLSDVQPARFTDTRDMEYTLDLCQQQLCGNGKAYGCQYVNREEFSLGRSKAVVVADGEVTVHLTGGDRCSSVDREREAFVTLQCPVCLLACLLACLLVCRVNCCVHVLHLLRVVAYLRLTPWHCR